MRSLALSILLSSLVCLIAGVPPARAGDYYGSGYYGDDPYGSRDYGDGYARGYSDPHYRYPSYYGPVYPDGAPYYTPAPHARYYRPAPAYDGGYYRASCGERVRVDDGRGGWVWGYRPCY